MKRFFIVFSIILFIALAIVVVQFAYHLASVRLVSHPSIRFIQPVNNQVIPLDGSLVRFIAQDSEGIEHIELWADGELYASQKSELPQGSDPFPFAVMWQPHSSGRHILTARAYNSRENSAIVSVSVQVSGEADGRELSHVPTDEIEAGETLDAEDVTLPASEEDEEGVMPLVDDSIVIPPLDGLITEMDKTFLDTIIDFRLQDLEPYAAILVEVEALYLETDRMYDGVFCYLKLADYSEERIPDDDGEYITAGPGNSWDIQSLAGRENSRIVYLREEALGLQIRLECWGVNEERGTVYNLGELIDVHPDIDWDGHTIDKEISGPSGSFRVGYRIQVPTGDELPPPEIIHYGYDYGHRSAHVRIDYPSAYREKIDGFVLQMDGTLVAVKDNKWLENFIIGESPYYTDSLGPFPHCGQTATYKIHAYKGDPFYGTLSPPSNSMTLNGSACYQWAVIEFEQLYLECLSGDDTILDDVECPEPPGPLGEDDLQDEHSCIGEGEYRDYMGCSYGTLWANEEEIHIGEMGPSYGYCLELADDTCYKVSDISHECNDRIWVPLEEDEMLVIGMNWYDEDSGLGNSDDLQCEGYVAYTAHDFSDLVANQPNRRLTRAFWFSQNGGGTCGLKYIIYALEETPPSE